MTTEAKNAIAMSREVLSGLRDLNNIETTSGIVPNIFHTHFVDLATGEKGIADLICRILREREAIFPLGAEQTELRQVAIAGAMFTDAILAEVEMRFTAGSIRYPAKTVRAYLSVHLGKSGKVGKVQLTNLEDKPRPCCKPRCKWFLIA